MMVEVIGVTGETTADEVFEGAAEQVELPVEGKPALVEQMPASTKFWSHAPASNSL